MPRTNPAEFPPLNRPLAIALTLIFCVGLLLPGLVRLSGLEPRSELVEKRVRQKFPDLMTLNPVQQAINIRQLRTYFNDRFGLRSPLISMNANLRVRGFHTEISDQVVIGKEGWLYLKARATMPVPPFSETELLAWQQLFETRQSTYAQHGASYLVMIAPNKSSIYPEYLPDYFEGVHHGQRYHQLQDWMQQHSEVRMLDLHQVLRARKEAERVYYAMGTHWNPHGAFQASRALAPALGVPEPRVDEAAYSTRMLDNYIDELPNLLGLTWPGLEQGYALEPKAGFTWEQSTCSWDTRTNYRRKRKPFTTTQAGFSTRLLVYRDSFFTSLQPFVSEFCGQATFVWSYDHDLAILFAENPDWVVDELVERMLTLPPPKPFTPPKP
jgi:alginate O-acetyltransferase complex protein AlgJ